MQPSIVFVGGMYLSEYFHRETCRWLFLAAVNSQLPEINQMSLTGWMGKHPYRLKKKWTTDTLICMNLKENSQPQKFTYCVVLVLCNIVKWHNYRKGDQISSCHGLGMGVDVAIKG